MRCSGPCTRSQRQDLSDPFRLRIGGLANQQMRRRSHGDLIFSVTSWTACPLCRRNGHDACWPTPLVRVGATKRPFTLCHGGWRPRPPVLAARLTVERPGQIGFDPAAVEAAGLRRGRQAANAARRVAGPFHPQNELPSAGWNRWQAISSRGMQWVGGCAVSRMRTLRVLLATGSTPQTMRTSRGSGFNRGGRG